MNAAKTAPTADGQVCCDETWEEAYARFETPEEEIRKFTRRLVFLGARGWPRDAHVVELFCGRGNSLRALEGLGFTRLEGVDLSASLASQYGGPATIRIADCRELPFDGASKDIVIVQGGLHHLETLPDDLERTLAEARRVLRPGGRFALVEPWSTPFLELVHRVSLHPLGRRLSNKLDAFATMTEHEWVTYFQWLGAPHVILRTIERHFRTEKRSTAWGKLRFLGRPRGG